MNHSRSMLEAYVWSELHALKWARSLKHWPRRRYRLEDSSAGNSRLLKHQNALDMQEQYGGNIVELIPPASAEGARQTRYDVAAEGMPKCPHCKESKGKPCREPQGGQRMPHKKRIKLSEKKKA